MAESALQYLACATCDQTASPDGVQRRCPACGGVLMAHYDLPGVAKRVTPGEVAARPPGVWRWRELLPVHDTSHIVSQGEGGTPLIHAQRLGAEIGLPQLYIKDEGQNPAGSIMARGISVALSQAIALGIKTFTLTATGNAASALAIYAAYAGVKAFIGLPPGTPDLIRAECLLAGASLDPVEVRNVQHFSLDALAEPYRLEGHKTLGYEVALAFAPAPDRRWELPDVIVCPTGHGLTALALRKAFEELERLGWIGERRPRLVAVQLAECAPLVSAFEQGASYTVPWSSLQTFAPDLQVPAPRDGGLVLKAIRDSGGLAVAVAHEAIHAARARLAAREGLLISPEGAAALVAAEALHERGWLKSGERVVVINTASGLKYPH
jgi:threonine synthase